ncbi:MAG: HD domain-containing protein [Planctomycetota bacterium]|nr:HD domain-containing protein [Planctomycetota bacterium]
MASVFELALAGLLHDIGKFMCRAHANESALGADARRMEDIYCPGVETGGEPTHRHVLWSAFFVESRAGDMPKGISKDVVLNLVAGHHRPGTLDQVLLKKADELAWGGSQPPDGSEEKRDANPFGQARLRPVFEYLNAGPGPARSGHVFDYVPLIAADDRVLPRPPSRSAGGCPEDPTARVRALWDGFADAARRLPRDDAGLFLAGMQELLARYCWCLPAAPASAPDISLYEHSRAVAAIAAALGRYHGETFPESSLNRGAEEKFLLVSGLTEGAEEFVAAAGETGAFLAPVRARALSVALIHGMAALKVLLALGMPPCNLLYSDGERFLILAPRFPEAEDVLANQKISLDRWSYGESEGRLRIELGWTRARQDELSDFGALIERCRQAGREARRRPLAGALISDGAWIPPRFVTGEASAPLEMCGRCGILPAAPDAAGPPGGPGDRLCHACRRDDIVRLKAADRAAADIRAGTAGADIAAFGWGVAFPGRGAGETAPAGGGISFCYDPPDGGAPPGAIWASGSPLWRVGPEITLREMAEGSEGRAAVGYLAVDADGLFRFARDGARDQTGLRGPIVPRVLAAAGAVNFYMRARLCRLLRLRQPRGCAIAVSGDGAIVAGPWDKVLEFAAGLGRDFAAYVCDNPGVSLSVGFAAARPDEPPADGIRAARGALAMARSEPAVSGPGPGGRIAIFGAVLPLEDVPRILQRARALAGWLGRGESSRRVLRAVLEAGRMHREYRSRGGLSGLRCAPLLSNQVERHLRSGRNPAAREAGEYLSRLARDGDHPDWRYLDVAAACALAACAHAAGTGPGKEMEE